MLVLKSDKMTLTIQCKKKVHVLHIKLMKLIHIWINTMFSQPKPILIRVIKMLMTLHKWLLKTTVND